MTLADLEASEPAVKDVKERERSRDGPGASPEELGDNPTLESVYGSKILSLEEIEAGWSSNPRNPYNFKSTRRWRITATIALTGFISTSASSIVAPAVHAILRELEPESKRDEKFGILLVSLYVVGLGTGPLIWAPLSELYGRQLSYFISMAMFVIFAAACCANSSLPTLIVLRFWAGVAGSSAPSLGVATVSDLFPVTHRGLPTAIYALGPMGGPAVATMLGFWLLLAGWSWVMRALAIICAVNFVLICLFMEETYAPVLKRRVFYEQTHQIVRPTFWLRFSPSYQISRFAWLSSLVSKQNAKRVFGNAFSRPPRLLFTNPPCLIFSIYYSFLYGIIYVFIVSTPMLFGPEPWASPTLFHYSFAPATISLAYLPLAIGFFSAAIVGGISQDRIYRIMSKRNHGKGRPEFRLILVQVGMAIFPIGLLIFSWTAHAQTHWIGPMIGQAIFSLGLMLAFNCLQGWLVDAFFPYSAAAIAAATALRSIFGAVLPIVSPTMWKHLGWAWGGTMLAAVAAVALPAPLIMFKKGQALREKYAFHG